MTADLGQLISLLCSTLRFAGWIAQWKDDGTCVEACHLLQHLISEGSWQSRHAYTSITV